VHGIFLESIEQFSPQTFSFIAKYVLEASLGAKSSDFILKISIGGNQIPPPYVESYIIQPLLILDRLNQLRKQGKIFFIPSLCLSFSYLTQIIEGVRLHELVSGYTL
jgi:hypothetical protein